MRLSSETCSLMIGLEDILNIRLLYFEGTVGNKSPGSILLNILFENPRQKYGTGSTETVLSMKYE